MQQTSRLTARHEMTVPLQVRKALQLEAGDLVAFEIDGNEVRLRRAVQFDAPFTQALEGTLTEWFGENDDQAFKNL